MSDEHQRAKMKPLQARLDEERRASLATIASLIEERDEARKASGVFGFVEEMLARRRQPEEPP